MKATVRKGFTLIEILIVVIILGILAAIVIPQFTNASKDAKSAAAKSTVQSVRGQLELYKFEHNGDVPALADLWTKMTTKTTVAGSAGGNFGPYLVEIPTNPLTISTVVAAAASSGNGWVLDTDYKFWAVNTDGTKLGQ